jgi:hypothetical protein
VQDEERHVLDPCAEWRKLDGELGDPGVEIGAELPLDDPGPKVPVRRADDPHVDREGAVAAHGSHAPLLEHAEELGLVRERELADLVEEERAPRGLAEEPRAIGGRAREGALEVAEELALDDLVRDRRAVDREERTPAPGRELVQAPRG